MQPRDRQIARASAAVLGIATLGLAVAVAHQQIQSFDYWWMLRTGELILETGSVPRVDPYSYSAAGSPWLDIHWLFQVGLHGLYRLGGHAAVALARTAVVIGMLALLATIGWRRERAVVTAFALALVLLIAGGRLHPRPELTSFLLLAAVLALLERHERRPDAWIFALVPLQLVWANTHGLFAVGLALIGAYGLGELLRPLLDRSAARQPGRLLRFAAAALAAAAVCAINPNGLHTLAYTLEQLGMISTPADQDSFHNIIVELQPTLSGHTPPVTLLLSGLLGLVSLAALALNFRRVPAAHPIAWVAFAYLGLAANRNLALLAIVFAPIFVRNLNEWLDRHPPRAWGLHVASAAMALGIGLIAADVARGSFLSRPSAASHQGRGFAASLFPVAAVEWIQRERPPGPIYHHMRHGGYLIFHLYPDYRVILDGRLEVYGAKRFHELANPDPVNFLELDARYRFGAVLVVPELASPLIRWLRASRTWRLVVDDPAGTLFVRERH